MGFFKDIAENEKKRQDNRDEKALKKLMDKYNLQDLEKEDLQQLKVIQYDLMANGLGKTGMKLSFSKLEETMKITYLSALVEQNWMIIRQLAKINKNLEKLEK